LTHYLVTTKSDHGVKTNSRPFSTVDEALDGAGVLLVAGAPLVWIVDSYGEIVLPVDQLRVRLNMSPDTRHMII